MPRGGPRIGAGRPKKSDAPRKPKAEKVDRVSPVAARDYAPASTVAVDPDETPLAYMLGVMNDPEAEEARRDRMAMAAAPYLHAKMGEGGKKDEKARAAKSAGAGKFAPSAPPKLTAVK